MWRFVAGLSICTLLAACNQIFGIPEAVEGVFQYRIGGRVHGLWDGADGVALRIEADGVETLLAIDHNGSFQFETLLFPGVSYSVHVVSNPVRHTCILESGGNGVVPKADVASVSIACTGPEVHVALSGSWGQAFDATEESQTFVGSVVAQDVVLTIDGSDITSVTVDDKTAKRGEHIAPISLPLGSRMVPIALTAGSALSKTYQLVFQRGTSIIEQLAYGKASNTDPLDNFGSSVSLSGDTLAVGVPAEASSATGINGDQSNNELPGAGAVYVFVRVDTTWTQEAYIKSSYAKSAGFGSAVALSGDTLVVGALVENSAATGINGDQTNKDAPGSGAVYVFTRSGTSWSQQAYIKASNTDAGDAFGGFLALDGDTLAIGACAEASGIDGSQSDNSALGAGAVYVFTRSGATWAQQAYLKAPNAEKGDAFCVVSLSGTTLAVGAPFEDSGVTGSEGDPADNSAATSGAVYVFTFSGTRWEYQAYLKASNAEAGDLFGFPTARVNEFETGFARNY